MTATAKATATTTEIDYDDPERTTYPTLKHGQRVRVIKPEGIVTTLPGAEEGEYTRYTDTAGHRNIWCEDMDEMVGQEYTLDVDAHGTGGWFLLRPAAAQAVEEGIPEGLAFMMGGAVGFLEDWLEVIE